MSKIHFTFFAQAYYVDATWGFGCPSGGIRNLGRLLHSHGIPVTWLVSPKSARCEQEMFTAFHEEHGDEVAMFFRYPTGEAFHHAKERDVARELSVAQYQALVRDQRTAIQHALPWAEVKVAGQGIRTPALLEALAREGFVGMFGHCYCQIGTDSITDFGMPWGSFRLRPGSAHLPARGDESGGLVTFEWTMRDLNRAFHTCRPELWSTDPNDVERGGVCTDTNVEYWKALFQQYERALPLNPRGLWFQFHQEAHEQTWGEICKPFTPDRVAFCTAMMDTFFEWLVTRDSVEFLTATRAAELYRAVHPAGTLPVAVPFAWTPVPEEVPFWDQLRQRDGYSGNVHKNAYLPDERLYDYLTAVNDGPPAKALEAMRAPPWTDAFFYFDGDCQLVFDVGQEAPVALFNYLNYAPDPDLLDMARDGGAAPGFFLEPVVPEPEVTAHLDDTPPRYCLEVTNPRPDLLPYGVFLWEERFPGLTAACTATSPAVVQDPAPADPGVTPPRVTASPGQGVFVRVTLAPGPNRLSVTLGDLAK